MYISLNIALWFHILCSLKSFSWSSFDAVVFQFEWLLLNFPPKLGSCKYLAHRLFLLDFLGPAPKSSMTSGGTSSAHCCSCHADLKHSVCFWEPHASSALPTVAFFSVLTLLLEAVRFHASEETGTPADSSQASQGSCEPTLGESLNLSPDYKNGDWSPPIAKSQMRSCMCANCNVWVTIM